MSINLVGNIPLPPLDVGVSLSSLGFATPTHTVGSTVVDNADVNASVASLGITPLVTSTDNQTNVFPVAQSLSMTGLSHQVVGTPETSDTDIPASAPTLALVGNNVEDIVASSSTIDNQGLRDLGYLLADDYPGVDPSGALDSITGINQAIMDGISQRKAVWFSANAIYRVSSSVLIGQWSQFDTSRIQGGGDGDSRPLFVLDDGATGFGSAGSPRPVMCMRNFPNGTTNVWPADPLEQSGIWQGAANILFYNTLSNFRIDCGNNPGAFGLYAPAAQRCFGNDIEIDATGALGGIWGCLGRNAAINNLKVTGGSAWSINADMSGRTEETQAGVMIAGLTLVDAPPNAIRTDDFVPLMITGFDITMASAGAVWNSDSIARTGYGTVSMVDGKITSQGGLLFDNDDLKNVYLRNVYVTGTDDLVKSGGNATQTATGTWKVINEYTANDPTTYNSGSALYPTKSMIDGVISSADEPVADLTSSVSAPTVDYVDRHIISIPRADSGAFENIDDYGATRNPDDFSNSRANDNTAESSTAIAAAIAAAAAAGHNRVFVPNGLYYIDSPISLLKDTIFIGTGCRSSIFYPHDSWQPTSKAYLMETANDATGTCHVSSIGFVARCVDGSGGGTSTPYQYDWFSYVNWRTGKDSSSVLQYNGREFMPNDYACNPKDYYRFEGSAGGKHYAYTDAQGRRFGNADCRGLAISGTSQPLHLYGVNMEITKSGAPSADTNVEIQASSHVRLYGMKREGGSSTLLCNDSTNICFYGLGRQEASNGAYVLRVTGTSDDIVIAPCLHDSSGGTYTGVDMMREDLDGDSTYVIEFPEGVSIYRRGTPDDSLTVI